jgi:electron transfer flavoprotein alpha subunit
VQDIKPTLIGFSHTAFGADVAPRLAFRLDIAIATDCIAAEIVDEKLLLTRPCFGGKAYETLHCLTMPGIATFKPKSQSFPSRDDSRVGQIITVNSSPDLIDKRVAVVAREIRPHGGQRLKDARVVVGVGRGLKDKKGLDLARELAVTLDGAIGATRAACDIGLCEYTSQIGASGIIIAPDLYIAVGISGAGHHMVGCTSAKNIIAINIDPDAAVFAHSRFGVISDSHEFLPAFIEEIKKFKNQDRGQMA